MCVWLVVYLACVCACLWVCEREMYVCVCLHACVLVCGGCVCVNAQLHICSMLQTHCSLSAVLIDLLCDWQNKAVQCKQTCKCYGFDYAGLTIWCTDFDRVPLYSTPLYYTVLHNSKVHWVYRFEMKEHKVNCSVPSISVPCVDIIIMT